MLRVRDGGGDKVHHLANERQAGVLHSCVRLVGGGLRVVLALTIWHITPALVLVSTILLYNAPLSRGASDDTNHSFNMNRKY